MPDWRHDCRKEASRRLVAAKFSVREREEIAEELSGYLDDLCANAKAHGTDDPIATHAAVAELDEDENLGAHLYHARKEDGMNGRTRRFWFPGFVILFASAISLAILQLAGFSPYFPRAWAGNANASPFLHHSLVIYLPWLCLLPFLGAAGAYWSRRAGSRRALCIATGLFPVLVFLGVFVVIFPVSFLIDTLHPGNLFLATLAGLTLSWVVIPGAALLLGILPFLRDGEAPRQSA